MLETVFWKWMMLSGLIRAYLQNSQWHLYSSHCCLGAAGKSVTWCQETESKQISPSRAQALWCTLNKQSTRIKKNASNLLQWRSQRVHQQSQDPLQQNADVQEVGRINKIEVWQITVRVESHGFKWHGTSSVPDVSECDTQRHWLWSGSQNPVTVQLAEAQQGAKRSHESFWEQQRTNPLRPCVIYWTCHPWKQDRRWSKSKCISVRCRIPGIHSMRLSKKKRGVDWQETGPSRTINPACVRPYRA